MKKSLCIIFLFIGISLSAQDISLKTNLLYDISTTFNLGAEFRLAPKWTLDVSANYNPFTFSDSKKWKHWMAQPEARYWLCEAFNGHFFGLHLLGGQFNVGNVKFPLGIYPTTKDYRYEGYYYGAGYVQNHYDKYDCPKCGEWKEKNDKGYFSVTKAAVSLIYVIK